MGGPQSIRAGSSRRDRRSAPVAFGRLSRRCGAPGRLAVTARPRPGQAATRGRDSVRQRHRAPGRHGAHDRGPEPPGRIRLWGSCRKANRVDAGGSCRRANRSPRTTFMPESEPRHGGTTPGRRRGRGQQPGGGERGARGWKRATPDRGVRSGVGRFRGQRPVRGEAGRASPRGDGWRTVSRRLAGSSAGAGSRCRARPGRPGCRTPRSTSTSAADPGARPPRSR